MLQQLQRAQEGMLKAQEELAAMTVTSTVGGGAVSATITGERRVQSLTILPEVVDPEDVEMPLYTPACSIASTSSGSSTTQMVL